MVKHAVKVVERVFEHKIRQQTTQMQEKFTVKGKKPYFIFVDLEKLFDRVPREVLDYEVEGVRPRGRPKKTLSEVVEKVCHIQ